jgi:hypothetical protein
MSGKSKQGNKSNLPKILAGLQQVAIVFGTAVELDPRAKVVPTRLYNPHAD